MTNLLRLPLVLLVFILTSAGAIAQQSGSWSVNQGDRSDVIASNVNQNCTYRITVDDAQGEVDVIVRNANGEKVAGSSGSVEGGDSRDFDLQQGWSIEVHYKKASSTGSFQRLL
jgi:hypothetical protein